MAPHRPHHDAVVDVLDEAYAWLCRRRREAPFWHDVWHWRWTDVKPRLQDELRNGTFRLGPTGDEHEPMKELAS